METDRDSADSVREFRLEGPGLIVLGGLIIAAIAGAFLIGRWYERTVRPVPNAAGLLDSDPLAHVADEQEPADVAQSTNFFDTLEGENKEAEPQRETAGPAPAVPAAAPAAAASGGDYYVQVFAGRDRKAAEGLIAKLQSEGDRVRLFSEKEGQGSLFKVRVGGFADEEGARKAAGDLVRRGYAGAWVTKAGD